jgi:KAP family P-loop domain
MTHVEEPASPDRCRLLGDQVFSGDKDPLGHDQAARMLARRILDSVDSTPFTVGITADWGMGKSSLMRRLREELTKVPPGDDAVRVAALDFNPWTAHEGEILEGLLKTVLDEVDSGPISRARRGTRLKRGARVATTTAATFVPLSGAAPVVDALWQLAASDPAVRNKLRGTIEDKMRAWACADSDQVERLLVVFVDDLDRCTPATVLEMFEAIKVYMDVFGIVFVVAYDERVVADALKSSPAFDHYDDDAAKQEYLEKIIQLVYRLPDPGDSESHALVESLIAQSATGDLFNDDERAAGLIAEWTRGNPRRIKRLINALIVNHRGTGQATKDTYLAGTALYMYYPEFSRRLNTSTENESGEIKDFYHHVRMREAVKARDNDAEAAEQAEQHFEDAWGVSFKDDDSTTQKLARIDAKAPGNDALLFADDRFREITAMLAESDEPGALREISKQHSASKPPPAVPDDHEARAAIAAVRGSKFKFRTAEGVAKQVGLPVEAVHEVFRLHPDQIRRSPIPDAYDRTLYAAQPAPA